MSKLNLSHFKNCPLHGHHTGASCPRCSEAPRQNLPRLLDEREKQSSGSSQQPASALLLPKPSADTGSDTKTTAEQKSPMGEKTIIVHGNPTGKPRQTQRDKWMKRPSVVKYREWADKAREAAGQLPDNPGTVNWTAYFEIPESWSKKKKKLMAGAFHRQKPDRDNVDKCVLDSLFSEDSGIHSGTMQKRWDDGNGPRIEIEIKQ